MSGGGLLLRQTCIADGSMAHDAGPENRRRALETMGLDPEDLVVGEQVHGKGVRCVTTSDRGRREPFAATDGFVTRDPGIALMVLGADCPLVCLYDPEQSAVAVIHAGWRGVVSRVLEEGLKVLDPAEPKKVRAFLGPCAGPCCYEVGEEVARRFPEDAVLRQAGRIHLDLPRAVERELRVPIERIGPECTICGEGAYSHRRDGTADRHAMVAALVARRKP